MNITNFLRRNIGLIITIIGFMLLCIMTFGDLGEITTTVYWASVANNLTSIGFMTIGLTLIQFSIKQGLAEQALQRGLNTEKTTQKYNTHKEIIGECTERLIYLPYFLQIYNKRHTGLRKREFLVNNNFTSEASLYRSGNKKLIKLYKRIIVNVTSSSIKWSTVEIIYNNGRIITLNEHRQRRVYRSVVGSFVSMIGVTFLTGGLFFSPSAEPLWQKFVKLFTYMMSIAIGAIFTVIKEYEKGAFGIPNELDEINQIWYEFKSWTIPERVLDEVQKLNESMEVTDESRKDVINDGADLSSEQKTSQSICNSCTDNLVSVSNTDDAILPAGDKEFGR